MVKVNVIDQTASQLFTTSPVTFNVHTFLILLVCYNCLGVNWRNSYAFHMSTIVALSLTSVEEGHDPF